jgi:hypothetical protein
MEEAAVSRARHGSFACLLACLGLAAIAGCAAVASGQPVGHPASSASSGPASATRPATPSSGPSPQGVNVAAFDALAQQEAAAWARSPLATEWRTGLVVLSAGSLSSGPSGGFPSGAAKLAFVNGDLVFTGQPPSGAPSGVVTWSDGSTMKVKPLSETQVFAELASSRHCPGCTTTPLAVIAVRPATMDIATSRGTASVPAWSFTLQGVSAPVIQAALPSGSYATLNTEGMPAEKLRPLGASFVGGVTVTPSADGRTLTVGLPGGSCETTWGGLVSEVGGVVVVGGWLHNPNPDQACAGVLLLRKVTVHLAAPLDDRVVIDGATGQPATREPAVP